MGCVFCACNLRDSENVKWGLSVYRDRLLVLVLDVTPAVLVVLFLIPPESETRGRCREWMYKYIDARHIIVYFALRKIFRHPRCGGKCPPTLFPSHRQLCAGSGAQRIIRSNQIPKTCHSLHIRTLRRQTLPGPFVFAVIPRISA